MTSQNIRKNMQTENLKRRLLPLILGSYTAVMVSISAAVSAGDSGTGDPRELFFGSSPSAFIWLSAIIAAVCAIHGFSFLFSRIKTDFYYSLPVTRKELFLSVYLNGILSYAVPCLLYHLILAGYGYLSGNIRYSGTWIYMMISFLLMMAGYLLLYHLAAAAVMLCGSLTSACAVVLIAFGTAKTTAYLAAKYSAVFFSTYLNSNASDKVLGYFSPVTLLRNIMWTDAGKDPSDWGISSVVPEVISVVIGAAVLGGAAYWLFLRRPGEGAGRTVVFRRGQTVLSAVLVILSSLAGGFALMNLFSASHSAAAMSVGLIASAAAVHGLLQMIYEGSVHAFSKKKVQFLVFCAVSIFITMIFRMDLLGYDRFFPKEEKVEHMAVSIKGLSDLYAGSKSEQAERADAMADMRFDNMKLAGAAKKAACRWMKTLKTEKPKGKDAYSFASVRCRMKDGRDVYRQYYIPSQKVLMKFSGVFESPGYQEGEWPVLRDGFAVQKEVTWSNGAETFTLNLNEDEKKVFLDLYCKELKGVKLKELAESAPIGTMTLTYGNSMNGEFSFIYPGFEKTISYLEKKGIPARRSLSDYEPVEIAVRERAEDGSYAGREQVYTDPAEMKEMIKQLVCEDYHVNPLLYPMDDKYVYDVKLKGSAGDTVTEVRCVKYISPGIS